MTGDARHQQHEVAVGDAGRVCPYCRFALKAGVLATTCGDCGALHHGDCWVEGRGCAVVGCAGAGAGGPTSAAAGGPPPPVRTSAPPPAALPSSAASAWAAPPAPSAPPPSRGGTHWLAAAVVILAVVIGGSVAALLLSRDSGSDATAGPAREAAATTTTRRTSEARTPTETSRARAARPSRTPVTVPEEDPPEASASSSVLPDVSQQQMEREIADVVGQHHRLLQQGSYRSAFALLSARKQHQLENEVGFDGWRNNQTDLRRYVGNLDALDVTIQSLDRRHGVATIMITGPRFDLPNNACGSRYSGITWAKYEDGSWTYEPGFSTTPQRRREWGGSRRYETLAYTCFPG